MWQKALMATTLFVGPGGAFATLPMKILLLRDNVQHHLQAGRPLPGYLWIHAIADAVIGVDSAQPPACELWTELSLAFDGIREIGIEDLAMSLRTRSALTGVQSLPAVRGTILLRRAGWPAPLRLVGANTLGDLFGGVVRGIERITLTGNASGNVEVISRPGAIRIVERRTGRRRRL
jgi:hypothetical protein